MKKDSAKRSSLFLIELMTAILFFALASAVCIQVFTKSHLKSLETEHLNMAVSKAQSAAEIFLSSDYPLNSLADVFEKGQTDGNTYTVCYNEDFKPVKSKEASFQLTIQVSEDKDFQKASIHVRSIKTDRMIYSLNVKKHIPASYQE